ncbi:MAG: nicotinamide mononucleotide transporter [Bacteroidales bacterium]|nr:nicotinamide mononucleotide transporter [Bacteroidales bacterium]
MNTLDIIGATIGLAYIVSEYRAGRWFWPLSLLMSGFYAVIYFRAACYANFGICCYNFVMSVYGLMVWHGIIKTGERRVEDGERPIGSCPARYWPWIVAVTVVLTLVFRWLLGLLGESTLPLVDGLSSALNIVGMWMLSQKYWQQWFTWLIVEPLMIGLCLASGLYASAAMYAVYEVFVVMGIIRWKKLSI